MDEIQPDSGDLIYPLTSKKSTAHMQLNYLLSKLSHISKVLWIVSALVPKF